MKITVVHILLLFVTYTYAQKKIIESDKPYLKKYAKAIKKYNTDKDSITDPAEFYYQRGGIRQDYHDMEGAIKDYSKAIAIKPDNPKAYYNRGLAKLSSILYNEAIIDFDKAIELDPKKTFAYNNRGICKFELNDYEGALKDYDSAIALENLGQAYHNRAVIKIKRGQTDEACEDFHLAYKNGDKKSLISIKKNCCK